MTRTVLDNAMVAHVWAQLAQPEGRSHNGNFYFEGPFLYSYGRHYVVGYATPGGLFLLNADSSTMTTTGKHKPAAWRAVDYGRGKFANTHSVPGLTRLADVLHNALYSYSWGAAAEAEARGERPAFLPVGYILKSPAERRAAVPAVARFLESAGGGYWPGEEAAAAIFRELGERPHVAEGRARAGAARVAKAEAKAKADAARRELDSNARLARQLAKDSPAKAAEGVRGYLVKAAESTGYAAERAEEEARAESREYFRAAKAAKAKGWAAIARACRACYAATRAELARFERERERYAARARTRSLVRLIRQAPAETRDFWAANPGIAADVDAIAPAQLESALDAARRGVRGFRELGDALTELSGTPYAAAAWGPGVFVRAREAEAEARNTADKLAAVAELVNTRLHGAAVALWREGGRVPYSVGRLSDGQGGALLRAEHVTRDESGAITGGELVTSWGARVPLTHALKAFRFLKFCREKGAADSTFDGWNANGRTIRVGHFRVDSVDARGNFRAGCHRINWPECEALARALGVAELAPSDEALSPSHAAA